MHIVKLLCGMLAVGLSSSLIPAGAQSAWHVDKTMHVGGEGGFDYITVDPATHRLFVPRTTRTQVIDADSGKVLGDIPGQKKAHGVAIVPRLQRGFITDGAGFLEIFDLKTYAVLGTLTAQPDADGIIYDAGTDHVLVSAGDSGTLITVKPDVDPKGGKIEEPVELGGAPEFLAADGTGKVFVNLENKDNVAVVDLKARKVIAHWPVTPGGSPVGLSIDSEKHQLFIGCRKPQKLVVMSTLDGKVLADLPIGAGVDATSVDGGEVFASCGDGTLSVVRESSPGKFEVVQTVKTLPVAKTLAIDSANHHVYLPTAAWEPADPGVKGRGKLKPDSFQILEVSR